MQLTNIYQYSCRATKNNKILDLESTEVESPRKAGWEAFDDNKITARLLEAAKSIFCGQQTSTNKVEFVK